jgi:thiazole synthase ThiGH ThiG subunit
MKYAVKAGRLSYIAKAMKIKDEASPSSHKNSPL